MEGWAKPEANLRQNRSHKFRDPTFCKAIFWFFHYVHRRASLNSDKLKRKEVMLEGPDLH